MDFKSPLAKVRGLGSAQAGTAHWWLQKVTAVSLLPLTFIFLQFIHLSYSASYEQMQNWLSTPFYTACMIAWVFSAFYHAALGLQVVIEDYISAEAIKVTAIWTVNLIFGFLTLLAILAILRTILVG